MRWANGKSNNCFAGVNGSKNTRAHNNRFAKNPEINLTCADTLWELLYLHAWTLAPMSILALSLAPSLLHSVAPSLARSLPRVYKLTPLALRYRRSSPPSLVCTSKGGRGAPRLFGCQGWWYGLCWFTLVCLVIAHTFVNAFYISFDYENKLKNILDGANYNNSYSFLRLGYKF